MYNLEVQPKTIYICNLKLSKSNPVMPQEPKFPPAVIPGAIGSNSSPFFGSESFLHKLNVLLNAHYDDEHFGACQLSRLLHLCPMQTHRKVKKYTGMSPGRYILHFRLEKSLYLLQHTELRIGEIAWQTGFCSQSYFARAFRQVYGLSPHCIRQRTYDCYYCTTKG